MPGDFEIVSHLSPTERAASHAHRNIGRRVLNMLVGALMMLALVVVAARIVLPNVTDIQGLRDWSTPAFDVTCGIVVLLSAWSERRQAYKESTTTLWPLVGGIGLAWIELAAASLP